MATAGDKEKTPSCVICHEKCTGSRKLPECGHHCCETCILIYVSKLKDEGDLEIGFPCQSCEVINPGPKDIQAAIGWIKSLERPPEEVAHAAEEEESHKDMCSSCRSTGTPSNATKLCLDCAEALCQPCSLGRHSHSTLREHKVIDIGRGNSNSKETNKLFRTMCELVSCDNHPNNPIMFYCNDHEEYGCETCVDANHKKCIDVIKANACDVGEKIYAERETIEVSVENACVYAKSVIEHKKSNTEANSNEVEIAVRNLRAIRENAAALFQFLEASATKQAESLAKKRKTSNFKDTEILKDVVDSSKVFLELLQKLEKFGSRSQFDMVVRKIRERMKENENTLLNMSKTLKKTGIELKQEDFLQKLLNLGNNNINELVVVSETENKTSLPGFHSQLLLKGLKAKKMEKLSTKGQNETANPKYRCITILRNNDIVLSDDSGDRCLVIRQNKEITKPVNLSVDAPKFENENAVHNLMRLASNKDGIVAIPTSIQINIFGFEPAKNKIVLLSVNEELTIKGEVKTLFQPKAVHVLRNGDIAVAWNNPVAFGVISVRPVLFETMIYFRQDKSGRVLRSFDFMAVDEKRSHVIQPCKSDNAVYCFDFDGNPKFKYESDNGSSPTGVDLDGDTNVYVCFARNYSASIHVISPEGTMIRTIVDDCPSYPLAIAFNKSGDEFAVIQDKNHVVTRFKLQRDQ